MHATNPIRRIATWTVRNKNTIGTGLISAVAHLLRIALTIGVGTLAAIGAGHAWASTNGDSQQQGLYIAYLIGALAGMSLVRYLLRLVAPRASAAGLSTASAGAPGLRDHDEEALQLVVEHEATHAVIADVLGDTVLNIRTRQIGNSAGHTKYELRAGLGFADLHWHQALFSLAPVGINAGYAQTDDMNVFSHLTQIIGSGKRPTGVDCELTLSELHREAIAQARALVDENQAAITHLTQTLIEHRVLEGEDLRRAMEDARTADRELTAPCHGEHLRNGASHE